jgi:hypothetical protein
MPEEHDLDEPIAFGKLFPSVDQANTIINTICDSPEFEVTLTGLMQVLEQGTIWSGLLAMGEVLLQEFDTEGQDPEVAIDPQALAQASFMKMVVEAGYGPNEVLQYIAGLLMSLVVTTAHVKGHARHTDRKVN